MLYLTFDVGLIGSIIFFFYIAVDCFKNKKRNILKRIIFYSFIIYMLFVAHFTIGEIVIPPLENNILDVQLIPFYFIHDLITMYHFHGLDWFFWNSLKLTFFNFLMFIPLGIYLSYLFEIKGRIKSLLIILLTSLIIEVLQLILTYFGLIMTRGFNIDDIIINSIGGFFAYTLCELIVKSYRKKRQKHRQM